MAGHRVLCPLCSFADVEFPPVAAKTSVLLSSKSPGIIEITAHCSELKVDSKGGLEREHSLLNLEMVDGAALEKCMGRRDTQEQRDVHQKLLLHVIG